jgi:hypothetical protein
MKAILNSILVKRIVIESNCEGVLLNCEVFEGLASYHTDYVLSSSAFNQFLNECFARGIELDFENKLIEHQISLTESISILDVESIDNSVFLPTYCLPEMKYQMRA